MVVINGEDTELEEVVEGAFTAVECSTETDPGTELGLPGSAGALRSVDN